MAPTEQQNTILFRKKTEQSFFRELVTACAKKGGLTTKNLFK
jgi:hypothetical protein